MIIIIIIIIIIVIFKKNEATCIKMFFFISAICHSQWYFTYNVLQFFFHNHVSQSAGLSLSFNNGVRFLDIL